MLAILSEHYVLVQSRDRHQAMRDDEHLRVRQIRTQDILYRHVRRAIEIGGGLVHYQEI